MIFTNNNPIIIGIDHGYGNIKTAHCCFRTGVAVYDKEPTFKNNLLVYENNFYTIGEEHKEFISDKMTDEDYYILTLAAIARELNIRNLIVTAINYFFERQERIAADPYLETREKEDAFLQRITETIKNSLMAAPAFVQSNITSTAMNSLLFGEKRGRIFPINICRGLAWRKP